MNHLRPQELDQLAVRLEQIAAEEARLRQILRDEVERFGSIPPRADKSKRLFGEQFQFTLTCGTSTEIRDAEVESIREVCPASIFRRLFHVVEKFKLAEGATMLLSDRLPEGAPRNLRTLFHKAVVISETAPRLRIEKLECPVTSDS